MDEQIVRENELLEQQRVCMLGQKLVQAQQEKDIVDKKIQEGVAAVYTSFESESHNVATKLAYLKSITATAAERWFDKEYPEGIEVCVGRCSHTGIRHFDDAEYILSVSKGQVILDFDEADHPYDRHYEYIPFVELEKFIQDLI